MAYIVMAYAGKGGAENKPKGAAAKAKAKVPRQRQRARAHPHLPALTTMCPSTHAHARAHPRSRLVAHTAMLAGESCCEGQVQGKGQAQGAIAEGAQRAFAHAPKCSVLFSIRVESFIVMAL